MSKFSNYLKKLINDRGESISSLARNIGAERTSIHKALSDERILSYKTIQALARHFNLSVDDRKEFFQLYDILLQGEETYNNRQAVCRLLNNLASVDFSMASPPEVSSLNISNRLIKGEFAVRSAIRSVLIYEISHTENAEFHLFLPTRLELTIDFMESWLDNRKFTVNELLCFESSSESAAKNLELLHTVIPLCLASRGQYKPYYFHETPKAISLSPMGYYIVSPHYLILFSEDLSTAQILESEELLSYYRNFFKNLLLQCEPLTQCS